MRKFWIALVAFVLLAAPVHAQIFVRQFGVDDATKATSSNPFPIQVQGGLLGVKGSDGATIVGPSNPLPVQTEVQVNGIDTLDSITDPVKLVGKDGTTIHNGTTNPIAVQIMSLDSSGTLNYVDGSSPTQYLGVRVTDKNGNEIAADHAGIRAVLQNEDGDFFNAGSLARLLPVGVYWDNSGAPQLTSGANPLPVTLGSSPVGVFGTSGNSIAAPTNPLDVRPSADGTNPVDSSHGLYVNVLNADSPTTASNPIFTRISANGTDAVDVAHPLFSELSNGTNAIDTTHPLATQLSQGDAAISASNPVFAAPDGVATADITNAHANIDDEATTITLDAASRHLVIWTSSGASDIVVTFNGDTPDASTGAVVYGGGSLKMDFGVPITSFKYIGTTATGVINYAAQ